MTSRITLFAALALLAGNASADFFDGFDMGNFFGNNRQQQFSQTNATGQTYGNSNGDAKEHSRGRGAADINMDFDLNFRAKADSIFNADSRAQGKGDVAQYQNRQFNAYGTGYNNASSFANTSQYPQYSYPYSYYPYYAPYMQQSYQSYPQAYYPPQYYYPQAYYLPPAQ